MVDQSYFMDKSNKPGEDDLRECLGSTFSLWTRISYYVYEQYPKGVSEWNFPGKKYGWSFRIKDKRRAILYLMPRDGFFKVAFVFGQKATDHIQSTDISDEIKDNLNAARKYAEGRGVQIEIKNSDPMEDIEKLVKIKLRF